MYEIIQRRIEESIAVKKRVLEDDKLVMLVANLAEEIARSIQAGKKIVICGNGGSASDALHFAGEIVGRFQQERNAWPAVVLNADVATMTAIANDYGYENIYARQAQGHVKQGDVFIGISTSGSSENVYRAIEVAKKNGAVTAALLGKDGGKILNAVEYPMVVKEMNTARIQECHILLIHILCELVEKTLG